MAAVAATDALITRSPATAAAAVRAIVKAQHALKNDVQLAFDVGRKLFPATAAGLESVLVAIAFHCKSRFSIWHLAIGT